MGELETFKTPSIVPLFRSRCVRTRVSTPKMPGTPCSVNHSSSVFWLDQWLGREREWTTNPLTFTESDSKWSGTPRSEEHTSELQSRFDLVCRLLLEKKNKRKKYCSK